MKSLEIFLLSIIPLINSISGCIGNSILTHCSDTTWGVVIGELKATPLKGDSERSERQRNEVPMDKIVHKRSERLSCTSLVILKETPSTIEPKESQPALPFKRGENFTPLEKAFLTGFTYEVRFNGIKVGRIGFEYLGRKEINKVYQDIFMISSNVNILKLFQIQSRELVYTDIKTYLPQKIEREVKFLGRQESILEEYNQKDGWVKIILKKGKTCQERIIYQEPPIHNSLILFFLYPLNLEEKLGKILEFNLPLQKIKLKVKELRKIQTPEGIDEVYRLEVSNHRKSLVWIKKGERLPISLEVPAFLGKIVIVKK